MEYIIDGLNVIKTSFIKKYEVISLERGREFLIYILERYKRKHPYIEFTIVFDGYCQNFNLYTSRLKIIFSNEITADEKIREILENRKNKKEVFVVSDDREIQQFTRILGGNFLKVNEFLDIVYPVEKKGEVKKDKEIDYRFKLKIEKELEKFYGEKVEKNREKDKENIRGRR